MLIDMVNPFGLVVAHVGGVGARRIVADPARRLRRLRGRPIPIIGAARVVHVADRQFDMARAIAFAMIGRIATRRALKGRRATRPV